MEKASGGGQERVCRAQGQGSGRHIQGVPSVSLWRKHRAVFGTREKAGKVQVWVWDAFLRSLDFFLVAVGKFAQVGTGSHLYCRKIKVVLQGGMS